jgi:hypothetical protein
VRALSLLIVALLFAAALGAFFAALIHGVKLALVAANATEEVAAATWLLVALGILTSIVFSSIRAYHDIFFARKTAREKNTLSFIKDYNDNARTDDVYRLLRKMRDENLSPPNFDDKENEDRKNFLALMNKLEALAIGVKYNVYDEQLIREMFGNEVKEVCQIAKPLIALIRKEEAHPTAFCELEKLAKRLADAP